jgi:hypothetical protein
MLHGLEVGFLYIVIEDDTRVWCGTKPRPNRAKVGPVGPTTLVGQPGVGAFSNSALPTCQGRSVHGASNAQSWHGSSARIRLGSMEVSKI